MSEPSVSLPLMTLGRGKHSVLGKGEIWGGTVATAPLPCQPIGVVQGLGSRDSHIHLLPAVIQAY